jgi:hypothetical protein
MADDPKVLTDPPPAKPLTEERLGEILGDFSNKIHADNRRMMDSMLSQAKPEPAPVPSPTPAPQPDTKAVLGRERATAAALRQYPTLTPAQIDHIYSSVDRDEPELDKVNGYIEGLIGVFGVSKGPAKTEESEQVSKEPNPNPVTDAGAPAVTQGLDDGPVWDLDEATVNRLVEKKGYVAAGQELRSRFKRDMQGKHFDIRKR